MSKSSMEEFKKSTLNKNKNEGRSATGPVDQEHEAKVNEYIAAHRTWRENVPILRAFEYWRLRADYFPYIKQADSYDDFFLRGITCHPRLSDYPMCKSIIRDYFVCRDTSRMYQLLNVCAPLKEQMSACINVVFVKNHQRGDKKFNEKREDFFEANREKRLSKMMDQATTTSAQRQKFSD